MAKGRVMAAALQYSKWMSRFICWAWILYRFAALVAGVLRPEAAEAFASTLINLDWIMLVNEGTYLINSLGEKYIFSDRFVLTAFNKGWFKSLFKGVKTIVEEDEEEEDCSEDTTDEGNG